MDFNIVWDANSILCTSIQAAGGIITALIAAFFGRKIIKEDIKPLFQSYSDKSYSFPDLIKKARHNIVIVGSSGYRFLRDHGEDIEEKLKQNVTVYYLFLNESGLLEMERYRHGGKADIDESIYPYVKEKLEKWGRQYNSGSRRRLRAREFSGFQFMTAAYVGVDIPFGEEQRRRFPNAVIQIVPYQYGRRAKNSPLAYLTPKRDKEHYDATVDSLNMMWESSEPGELYPADGGEQPMPVSRKKGNT